VNVEKFKAAMLIPDLIVDQAVNEVLAVAKAFSIGLENETPEDRVRKGLKRIVKTAWHSEYDGYVGPIEGKMKIFYASEKKLDWFDITLEMWWTETLEDMDEDNNICISFNFYHQAVGGDNHLEFCEREDFFNDTDKCINVTFRENLTKYVKGSIDYYKERDDDDDYIEKYEKRKKEEELYKHYEFTLKHKDD
jgi:hypothetical protein